MFQRWVIGFTAVWLGIGAIAGAQDRATVQMRDGSKFEGRVEELTANGELFVRVSQNDQRRVPVSSVALIDKVGAASGLPDTRSARHRVATLAVAVDGSSPRVSSLHRAARLGYRRPLAAYWSGRWPRADVRPAQVGALLGDSVRRELPAHHACKPSAGSTPAWGPGLDPRGHRRLFFNRHAASWRVSRSTHRAKCNCRRCQRPRASPGRPLAPARRAKRKRWCVDRTRRQQPAVRNRRSGQRADAVRRRALSGGE